MLFNQIGQPRWNSPLVRFFGMKVHGAAAPCLAPEIAPGFDVNQMDDPSLPFLRGEKRMMMSLALSAAPGFFSSIILRNPAASGILVVVQRVLLIVGGITNVGTIASTADLTNSIRGRVLDTRMGTGTGAAVMSSRNDSAGPIVGTPIARHTTTNVDGWQQLEVVISPGFALCLESSVVNQALTASLQWWERPLPAEEESTG